MRSAPPRRFSASRSFAGTLAAVGLFVGLVACGDSDSSTEATAETTAASTAEESPTTVAAEPAEPTEAADQLYPDVVDAVARPDGDAWAFDVTISSPYDTPERYADGWRVLTPDGAELGFRLLTHDHASEQPFTRSLGGVEIPDDVDTVIIEGRDQLNGFGGRTFELTLPR